MMVRRHAVEGILGENGAGKSTTFSCITGVSRATSGDAWVSGYSVRTETDSTHLLTGYCPQHDVLWESLTVEEHLLFYARLKGVPPDRESAHVAEVRRGRAPVVWRAAAADLYAPFASAARRCCGRSACTTFAVARPARSAAACSGACRSQ